MKIFTKKSILQKIIIAILIVLSINFIVPTYSSANFGGVLISPIVDLFCSIGDIVINLLQLCMTGDTGTQQANWSLSAFLVESKTFNNSEQYDNLKASSEGETVDTSTFDKGWLGVKDEYYIPVATYSPEQIFSGNVAKLDINFINPNTYTKNDGTKVESSASKLQEIIAKWYVALRNLAIVGLLSVLVYVGIRIILSSTANDKAKYKQMFTDWLIALCLLFFLHYIMSFIITLTESIVTAIDGEGESSVVITTNDGISFKTNLLGAARFKTQYADFGQKVTYLILYLALVIYTVLFTWTYLKRLLMMAFLTIIAPLVALTYPIDKISDGKAQAFDTWLKEYIFNALLQPFHLIIYIVFVGSAMDLASTNIIYAIAAMGFILPAEKILRNIFGFNKAGAGTMGALAGFSAASLLNKIGKGRSGGGSSKGGKENSNSEGEKPPRFEDKHELNEIELPKGDSEDSNNQNEDSTSNNTRSATEQEQAGQEQAEQEQAGQEQAGQEQAGQEQAGQEQAGQEQAEQEQAGQEESANKKLSGKDKIRNLARANNINPKSVAKGVGRTIGKAARFGTKTAFSAGLGTLAGAVTLASGGGLGGAGAAFLAGSKLGSSAGKKVSNIPGTISNIANTFRTQIDYANGNNELQKKARTKEFKTNEGNINNLRNRMTKENGGVIPSNKEVKEKMNSFDPYLAEGIDDLKTILKAQKAEQYGVSMEQSAKIAAIAKEKGIDGNILGDSKKFDDKMKDFTHEFKNNGYSDKDAKKMADYTLNVMKAQNGKDHNLQKVSK